MFGHAALLAIAVIVFVELCNVAVSPWLTDLAYDSDDHFHFDDHFDDHFHALHPARFLVFVTSEAPSNGRC